MKCHEVQAILSAYHDAELPTDQQVAVEVHLESCSECAARLAEIRRLSQTASTLPEPTPPRQLWKKVEDALNSRTDLPSSGWSRRWWRSPVALAAAAAFLLLAAGLGIYFDRQNPTNHDYLAEYWQEFETDPRKAQGQLLSRYSGNTVSDEEALRQVGYRPLTSAQVPKDIAVEKTYVLDMPCCKCIQTVCRRADGTMLTVFEHNEEQPGWFHGHPHVQIQSGGALCRVTELEVHLAASWRVGRRTVTIIGLRNVEELSQWVQALDPTSTKHQGEPTRVGSRGVVPNRLVHMHPRFVTDNQRFKRTSHSTSVVDGEAGGHRTTVRKVRGESTLTQTTDVNPEYSRSTRQ